MFGSLGFAELILAVLIFMGLVGVVFLFLQKSNKAEASILSQRPSIIMSESPSTASNVREGETRTKGPDEKFCQECGCVIRVKAEICPKCGVRQASGSPSGRNRVVAALFALILGWFGIHKFYLGKVGQGVLYLLFCWTFVPLVISLIEGIVYLTMTDGDFAAKYG
jgi:TM2 domain